MNRLAMVALGALVVTSCGGAQSTSDPNTPAPQVRSNANLLTEADLAKTEAPNAFLAVQQLRPTWIRGRGATMTGTGQRLEVVVYVDGARIGSPRELEQIPRTNIKEMRFYTPSDATTRWGTGHTLGAITVTTK